MLGGFGRQVLDEEIEMTFQRLWWMEDSNEQEEGQFAHELLLAQETV